MDVFESYVSHGFLTIRLRKLETNYTAVLFDLRQFRQNQKASYENYRPESNVS